tara:strand:+ start:47 stop:238 length:192 start_codon:yes stop_codon:yes gene_type:complete
MDLSFALKEKYSNFERTRSMVVIIVINASLMFQDDLTIRLANIIHINDGIKDCVAKGLVHLNL